MEQLGSLNFYMKRWAVLMFFAISFLIAYCGIWSFFHQPEEAVINKYFDMLASIAAALFFSYGCIIYMQGLIKRVILFRISKDGLSVLRESLIKKEQLISWDQISEIKVIPRKISNIWPFPQTVNKICIFLKDPAAYISTLPRLAKQHARGYQKRLGTPLVLETDFLDGDIGLATAELNAHFEKYKTK